MAKLCLGCLCFVILLLTSRVQGQNEKNRQESNTAAAPKVNPQHSVNPVARAPDISVQHQDQNVYVDMNEFRKELMYPYQISERVDISQTKSLHDEPLVFRLPFFGFDYRYIWVTQDGYAIFNKGPKKFDPEIKLPMKPFDTFVEQDPSLIAIWLARQEPSRDEDSGVYVKVVNIANERNRSLAERLVLDFQGGMIGSMDFRPTHAVIISWIKMRVAGAMGDQEKKNSYQMILGTDEKRTYAMFNYGRLEWSSSQDVYEGLKHRQAFIGFNAGNTTRTYEFKPYSRESRILDLAKSSGYGNGLVGRYYFQIDEEIWPGVCIDKRLDPNLPDRMPLTFFPRYGNMLGGTIVNVTGPCFSPRSAVRCKFEYKDAPGVVVDQNHAMCIMPKGEFLSYHGYIDLSVEVDDKPGFYGRFYVQPPDLVEEEVFVHGDRATEEAPDRLRVTWNMNKFFWNPKAPVMLTLWGYRETQSSYPRLEYIDSVSLSSVLNEREEYIILTENFKDNWNPGMHDITFGFIAVNLTQSPLREREVRFDPTTWSPPIPLSWYFRPQWLKVYGSNWKGRFCKNWFYNEREIEKFAITVPKCPCTMKQAMLDIGRFTPDRHCNVNDKKCGVFHDGALHCIRSGRPAYGTGAEQMCCYDNYGELLQTADTMYGGRPARASMFGKHPFLTRMMIPTLSHWLFDVMPFFYCCKWNAGDDDSETCQMYNYWRTSQDCSLYRPLAVGSVYGDPHFKTFDGSMYTFNGKGEFSLLRIDNNDYKFDVQARFEQVPRKSPTAYPTNATYLSAVVCATNISSKVEFRLRPSSARWRYHIYTIVDGHYVFFWDRSLQTQYLRGVTLYQPAGIANMSHIIAMFDRGAGVEVKSDGGQMAVNVFVPRFFRNKTLGLLGRYSDDMADDFMGPDEQIVASPNTNPRDIFERFGKKWRLTPKGSRGVGHTLFHHEEPLNWASFDDEYFRPDFYELNRIPPDHPYRISTSQLIEVCSNNLQCQYDYLSTGSAEYARTTLKREGEALSLHRASRERDPRCPALPRPINGRKSENRYYPGTSVIFSCNEGYRLVGHEVRRCREDGLWSWGIDPECVSDSDYNKRIAGIAVGIVVPVVFFVVMAVGCFIFHNMRRNSHYTNERGMPARAVVEVTRKTQRNSSIPINENTKETET